MVILFSGRKNKYEKEIIEILTGLGANYISDKTVLTGFEKMTIISEYKKVDLKIKKGIAVLLDDTERFMGQTFPKGITGICEDCNISALKLFSENIVPVVSCGMGTKNTVTLSSINDCSLVASIQRTITNIYGKDIEPTEYTVKLKRKYCEFSVMVSIAVLLLYGIIPKEI